MVASQEIGSKATLTLKLAAESGYRASVTYQVSPEEWGAILAICERKCADAAAGEANAG